MSGSESNNISTTGQPTLINPDDLWSDMVNIYGLTKVGFLERNKYTVYEQFMEDFHQCGEQA